MRQPTILECGATLQVTTLGANPTTGGGGVTTTKKLGLAMGQAGRWGGRLGPALKMGCAD